MSSNAVERLSAFMKANLSHLVPAFGGTSHGVEETGFEVSPREYLDSAERELAKTEPENRINCVAHLKRAADCQLDIFLHAYNLYGFVQSRGLGFAAKLQFLEDIALISSRSLRRLNSVRNEMEHEYAVPKLTDLEVYADLVHAFVAVLESTVLLLPVAGGDDYTITEDGSEGAPELGRFEVEYDNDQPKLSFAWELGGDKETYAASPGDPEFAYFFRVYLLLARRNAFETDSYVLSLL